MIGTYLGGIRWRLFLLVVKSEAPCRSLVAENHDVVLIEQDGLFSTHLTKRYDIIILGNGPTLGFRGTANIESCDIFIYDWTRQKLIWFHPVLAKRMGAKETVVTSAILSILIPLQEKNILGAAGFVNPEQWAARSIANILTSLTPYAFEHFVNGRVALMGFKVKDNSPCVRNNYFWLPETIWKCHYLRYWTE